MNAHVFDRFSRSAVSPGAGPGLAIAKRLVEAHGGRIRAESDAAGTTISFEIPSGKRLARRGLPERRSGVSPHRR